MTAALLTLAIANVPTFVIAVFEDRAYWASPLDAAVFLWVLPLFPDVSVRLIQATVVHGVANNILGLLLASLLAACSFYRFKFNWVPPLLSLCIAGYIALLLYPKVGQTVNLPGFVVLLAFAAVNLGITILNLCASANKTRMFAPAH